MNEVDTVMRIIWAASHFAGFVYIFRCWRAERKAFYPLFAANWLLLAAFSIVRMTLDSIAIVHVVNMVVVAPAATACGLLAFRLLDRHVSRRITTIRTNEAGEMLLRRFADDELEDRRETSRPPPT